MDHQTPFASSQSTTPNLPTPASTATPIIGKISIIDVKAQQTETIDHAPKRRKVSNPSPMWKEFTRIVPVVDPNKPLAKCNHCGHKVGVHRKNQGTSTMRSHLNACVMYKRTQSKLDGSQQKLTFDIKGASSGSVGAMKIDSYGPKAIRVAIAKFINVDELPFRIVSKDGFKDMIHTLEPRFKVPSRITVMKDCMKLYLEEKCRLKASILLNRPQVCFTTDTWTSVQNMNYMSVTAHFIDSTWQLHKNILVFYKVSDHKGSTIGMELEDCMLEWEIDKILTITVDNASSNDITIEHVKSRQLHLGFRPGKVVCNHDFLHMRCCAHILNLIVQDKLKELDDSVAKVRNLVKYVKFPPGRMDGFKKCITKRKFPIEGFLQLDVSTRWNSTYVMLDAAEKYQRVFKDMLAEDGILVSFLREEGHGRKGLDPPKFEDWEHVRHFTKFLALFHEVTVRISASNTVTTNLFFAELTKIHMHLEKYAASRDLFLANMAKIMQMKYNKYWGDLTKVNRLLSVAAVLDPQYKVIYLDCWFKKSLGMELGAKMTSVVRGTLDQLFTEYSNVDGSSSSRSVSASQGQLEMIRSSSALVDDPLYLEFTQLKAQQNLLDSKSKVKRYLMEDVEPKNPNFDILNWWRVNVTKFPILVRISRDVLVISITTVPSESVFSTGGQVLHSFRSSLAPKMVEGLICAQNWLTSKIIYSADDDEDTEPKVIDGTEDPASYMMDIEILSNAASIVDS